MKNFKRKVGFSNKEFLWKSYINSARIDKSKLFKSYGRVRKGDKLFYRNYHRELKNGNGLSLLDIVTERVKVAEELLIAKLFCI